MRISFLTRNKNHVHLYTAVFTVSVILFLSVKFKLNFPNKYRLYQIDSISNLKQISE